MSKDRRLRRCYREGHLLLCSAKPLAQQLPHTQVLCPKSDCSGSPKLPAAIHFFQLLSSTKLKGKLHSKRSWAMQTAEGACFQIGEMNLLMDRLRPQRQCCGGKNCWPCPLPSLYSDSDFKAGLAQGSC